MATREHDKLSFLNAMEVFWFYCLAFFIYDTSYGIQNNGHLSRFLENRMIRMRRTREEFKPKVCFELLGCFADPPPRLSLKRPPEHPDVIKTKFLIYTRDHRAKYIDPEVFYYNNESKSIAKSHFNASKSLKVIIHGFKGSGSDVGAIIAANLLLDLEDVNVIVQDWTRGAGSTYQAAVANTELVGRQLALILLEAINLGIKAKDIHIIGFSLGAHVAGCASEVLKTKNLLIGRITGLDPASPFFRRHILRERSRKLDSSDASLVDVIHTDGAEVFTDGFGLLKPIGHIDFFPNGGIEQPGCNDIKNSIVYSHFHEDILDRRIACSHGRGWELFVESLQSQFVECKLTGWPCTNGVSFVDGTCFPPMIPKLSQEMGYAANRGPNGLYYLATRSEQPFCGDPFRASVIISDDTQGTLGLLFIKIHHQNDTTIFKISCNIKNRPDISPVFYGIAATKFKSITAETDIIKGSVWYQPTVEEKEEVSTRRPRAIILLIDKFMIEDRKNNRWQFCKQKFLADFEEKPIKFTKNLC